MKARLFRPSNIDGDVSYVDWFEQQYCKLLGLNDDGLYRDYFELKYCESIGLTHMSDEGRGRYGNEN